MNEGKWPAVISRRRVLRGAGLGFAGAGAAALFGCGDDGPAGGSGKRAASGQLETTRIVFPLNYALCAAPLWIANPFLLADGFTDVEYSITGKLSDINERLGAGSVDMTLNFSQPFAVSIDNHAPITILGAVHGGCYELIARPGIESIEDLRGKTIGITQVEPTAADYAFAWSILAFVGIQKDVTLAGQLTLIRDIQDGRLDAVLAYPPTSQFLHHLKDLRVILSSMTDEPWANYYCCMIAGNRDWVAKHPEAAKRAMRAILKGADQCAREPERTAQYLKDNGFARTYDIALEVLQTMRYDVWRRFDPEDSLRFYALRLNETGVIKSTPNEVIARGSDWSMFNELREEMAFAPGFGQPSRGFAFGCEIDGRAKALRATGAPARPRGEGL